MIIFLDFDGVLHAYVRNGQSNRVEVLFCNTPLLWRILRACPKVRVVFSSSWREDFSFSGLLEFVTYGGGEDLKCRFIGDTPSLEDEGFYGRRDLEVQRWLNENNYSGPWLAIDDMAELFSSGHPNLYLVNGDSGLTDADVTAIIERIQSTAMCEHGSKNRGVL